MTQTNLTMLSTPWTRLVVPHVWKLGSNSWTTVRPAVLQMLTSETGTSGSHQIACRGRSVRWSAAPSTLETQQRLAARDATPRLGTLASGQSRIQALVSPLELPVARHL